MCVCAHVSVCVCVPAQAVMFRMPHMPYRVTVYVLMAMSVCKVLGLAGFPQFEPVGV